MDLQINEGDRPSRLQLYRYAAGELEGEERAAVEAHLSTDDEARAFVDSARATRPAPLDLPDLRDRAARQHHAPPKGANRSWAAFLGALVVAAAALFAFLGLPGVEPDGHDIRFRASDGLQLYHLSDRTLERYDGRLLGEGDVIGFKVRSVDHDRVVVLSVDSRGTVSVFHPTDGEAGSPLTEDGLVALPGSVVLDDAPGPEVFVAVFDADVPAAQAEARRAWQSGGLSGVLEWATSGGDRAAEVLERRP